MEGREGFRLDSPPAEQFMVRRLTKFPVSKGSDCFYDFDIMSLNASNIAVSPKLRATCFTPGVESKS